MSKPGRIAKLEALLARIRERSAEGHDLLERVPTDAPAPSPEAIASIPASMPKAPFAVVTPSEAAPEPEVSVGFEMQEPVMDLSEPFEDTADDDLDEAPSSSRRVITDEPEERLSDMAFGAQEPPPPRHTPPPESGRLPAAPQADFDRGVTGVRHATPTALASSLTPQITRPTLGRSQEATNVANVANVIGQAQAFAPKTFVELLDASLGL